MNGNTPLPTFCQSSLHFLRRHTPVFKLCLGGRGRVVALKRNEACQGCDLWCKFCSYSFNRDQVHLNILCEVVLCSHHVAIERGMTGNALHISLEILTLPVQHTSLYTSALVSHPLVLLLFYLMSLANLHHFLI